MDRITRLFTMPLDGRERGPSTAAALLCGSGLGLLWGVAARVWMRLISTRPEFSITGTAFIIGIAVLFGTCAGWAFAARRRGAAGWRHYLPRIAAVLTFLPFGVAGGGPLMLTVLLSTLAFTQAGAAPVWIRRVIRAVLLLPAAALVAFVAREILTDKPGPMSLVYILLYLLLLCPLFMGLRTGLMPRAPVPEEGGAADATA